MLQIQVNIPELGEAIPILRSILNELTAARLQGSTIESEVEQMGTAVQNFGQQEMALLSQINEATNGVASRLQTIIDNKVATALADAGVAPDQQQAILKALQDEVAVLNAIGADPASPTPATSAGTSADASGSTGAATGATDTAGTAPGGQAAEPTS